MVICIGCNKTPEDIVDFRIKALDIDTHPEEFMTPTQFVIEFEETYNQFEKGKFYCRSCYEIHILNGDKM